MRSYIYSISFITCIFYLILSYFYLTGFVSATNQNMPDLNKDILKHQYILTNIHSHLHKHCIEEFGNNAEFKFDINKNTYRITLSNEDHMGLVVYGFYECNNQAFCGSGGCKYFIITGTKVVSGFGHRPYSQAFQNGGYAVILPFNGGSCERSDGEKTYGADFCAGIAYWDKIHNTFISYGDLLKDFNFE